MGKAALKHNAGLKIDSLSPSAYDILRLARITIDNAALASTTAVHASAVCGIAQTVITTGFTNPVTPRVITLTSGGTADDIKAVQAVVEGTDIDDQPLSETMPIFTVNTATTVTGLKAFKTVTKVTVPAMDGAAAEVAVGTGPALGIPYKLQFAADIRQAYFDGAVETLAAVTVSATDLCLNTVTTTTALNGAKDLVVDVFVK